MAKQPPTTEPDAPEEAPAPSSPSNRPVLKKRVGRKKRHDELEQPDEFMEVGGTIVDWVIANGRSVGAVLAVGLAALLVMGGMEKRTPRAPQRSSFSRVRLWSSASCA